MKNRTHWALLLVFSAAIAVAGYAGASSGQAEPPATRRAIVAHRLDVAPPTTDAPPSPFVAELAGALERDASRWPEAAIPHVPTGDVAMSVAVAVEELGDEPCPIPMSEGDWRMTDSQEARGVLAMALAYFEGARFASYVDDLSCNDRSWRKSPEGRALVHVGGHCDGGLAYSLWQVHVEGMLLSVDPSGVTAEKMSDRAYAARVGLTLACRSLASTGSLVGYTGEGRSFHPKADQRLDFARRFVPRELQRE